MIVIKSKEGVEMPICLWEGYNNNHELEGCVRHTYVKGVIPGFSEKELKEINESLPSHKIKTCKGLTDFSEFYEVWHYGFEYSEKLYFTYKTENLEKTYSLTGFEVVDGYLKIETWKRSEDSCVFYELEEELRDRESRRYLNGLLEYLIMIDSGRRIPVRPDMSSVRKDARTIMRKQTPFRLKDVLGWQLFRQKGEPYPEDDKTDRPGHDCIEGRNHYLHRDYSPGEVKRLSTKINFNDSTPVNPDLPETVDLMEVMKIHGMISHRWGKKGEDITTGFEKYLQDADKAA
jgi:hypothetical protein